MVVCGHGRQAKLDAMAAAAACARGYSPAALAPHLPALWRALRSELLPAAPGGAPAPAPDEAGRAAELAAAGGACLTVRPPARLASALDVRSRLAQPRGCAWPGILHER